MLVVQDKDHYKKVIKFASANGSLPGLKRLLRRFNKYGGKVDSSTVTLFPDRWCGEHAIGFDIVWKDGRHWMNGAFVHCKSNNEWSAHS